MNDFVSTLICDWFLFLMLCLLTHVLNIQYIIAQLLNIRQLVLCSVATDLSHIEFSVHVCTSHFRIQ